MHKILQILILSFFFISCVPNKDSDDLWVYINNSPSSKHILLELKDDSIITTNIADDSNGRDWQATIKKYNVKNIGDNKFKIIDTLSDDAYFEIIDDDITLLLNEKPVAEFKRLKIPHSIHNITKHDFIGKSFEICNGNYCDTIFFFSENRLIYLSNMNVMDWKTSFHYNRYFLSMEPFSVPLVFDSILDNKSYKLYSVAEKESKISLKEVKSKISKDDLIGEWIQIDHKWNQYEDYLPPPPLEDVKKGKIRKIKTKLSLTISEDSIRERIFYRNNKYPWELSPDGKIIYFSNKDLHYRNYKILNYDEETEIIELTHVYPITEDTLTMKKTSVNTYSQ